MGIFWKVKISFFYAAKVFLYNSFYWATIYVLVSSKLIYRGYCPEWSAGKKTKYVYIIILMWVPKLWSRPYTSGVRKQILYAVFVYNIVPGRFSLARRDGLVETRETLERLYRSFTSTNSRDCLCNVLKISNINYIRRICSH